MAVSGCSREELETQTASSSVTATFQAGVNSYAGTVDGHITNQEGGNGRQDFTGNQALITKDTVAGYESEALIRFSGISLPAGAQVTAASVTLTFEDFVGGHVLRGYYLKPAWNPALVGWLNRDTGLTWTAPGAKGAGTDISTAAAFSDTSWAATGNVTRTYALDPATVQSWIDTPASNQGIVLFNNEVTNKVLRVFTSEASTPAQRPLLQIDYTIGGGGIDGGVDGGGGSITAHPRIWIDAGKLASLKTRALANDARWTDLAAKCASYGAVHPAPAVEDYCSGDICSGYFGEDYYSAMLNLGVCYQVGNAIGDARTAGWAQKADQLLSAMTAYGTSVGSYGGNDGYGIRFYGNALAIGYDWMHDYLVANHPALLPTIRTSLRGWYDYYQTCPLASCMREHPSSNYFSAYYSFLAYAGIAAEGDTADAATYWNRFLGLHNDAVGSHKGIADYFTTYRDGGGYPEGWEYGPDAVRTLSEPALAAMTGKGVDLITSAAHPYHYPLNSALYLMHFSWPSLTYIDDRDELHGFDARPEGEGAKCPGYAAMPITLGESLGELLRRWPTVVPAAAKLQSFVKQLRSEPAINDTHSVLETKWAPFLFWDDNAPQEPYTTLERAYRAKNEVAMRSDWTTAAVWASLRAIAYSDKDQQHEHPDGGALAITRGTGGSLGDPAVDVPFLVNPSFLERCYFNTADDLNWGDQLRADLLEFSGPHATLNTFRNSTTVGQNLALYEDDPAGPTNAITKYEDRNGFVYTRADRLNTLYSASTGITEWARDVVFLRPQLFVVYDRTTSTGGGAYMSWHFAPTPALATAPLAGTTRYNVNDTTKGVFRGSMTQLLPAATIPAPINVFGSNKLFRLEVHPTTASGSLRWLTLFDAASGSATVAGVARLIQNVAFNGAVITAAGQHNKVVVFGVGGTTATITGSLQFTIPAALSDVIVADLPSNAKYAVTATPSGGDLIVTIAPSATGAITTSAQGTLYVSVAAAGTVSPGT